MKTGQVGKILLRESGRVAEFTKVLTEELELLAKVGRVAMLSALDIVATPAQRHLVDLYQELGPLQRKRLLAGLDGLASPQAATRGRGARRRLATLIRMDFAQREWVRDAVANMPRAADPDAVAKILRQSEVAEIEELRRRLTERERRPFKDEAIEGSPDLSG